MNEELTVKKQLKISIPIALEYFINTLMTLVDTIVVTRLGTNAVGAIGAAGVIIDIMQMSIMALNISNTALLSKTIGENNTEKAKKITGNSILITLVISIITIIVVYFINPLLPGLFNVDKICTTYMLIRLIGFIPNAMVTVLTGHQRTIGKQGMIMTLKIIAVICNLILDVIVVKLGGGVAGVAWVTISIDTGLCIYLILKSNSTIKYKFDKEISKKILKLFKWNCMERLASRIDKFIFNILVSRIGPTEYAVHVSVIQIRDVSQAFIQGLGDGISISIGIESGRKDQEKMKNAKSVGRKLINIFSVIVPVCTVIIAIIIADISFKENELWVIFYSVLPLLIIGQYEEISGMFYCAILRGTREFKFLAQRNFITSLIKIVVATILSYTVLGIKGVWIAYAVYCIAQKHLSKHKYLNIEKQNKQISIMDS